MIAHVAERGESKGRVVLQFCTNRPSRIALEAAIRVAQAYNSEIESLFIEDQNLLQLASFPFAREIMLSGGARQLSLDGMEREIRYAFNALQREIEQLAAIADVPVHRRVIRDDPVEALRQTCLECGPWNLVALADPFTSSSCASFQKLFDTVTDATGMLVVGQAAKRTSGRIVVMTDETDRLPGMLRVAERLAALDEAEVLVSLIADGDDELVELETNARILLADRTGLRIGPSNVVRDAAAASEVLRRHAAGFVIARYGGLLVPAEGSLRGLSLVLECPMLLIR